MAVNCPATGGVMEMLSEHTLIGWLEGYLLSGRHGFFHTYEAFAHVNGYPWLIHKLAYRFKNHENIHVRGYKERGNINTPLLVTRFLIKRIALLWLLMSSIECPALPQGQRI